MVSIVNRVNRLTPNDTYIGRTAPLTNKRCILYIYSTNIGNEYFKHALFSPFFLLKTKVKVKVHPCTGTEALYSPYGL